MTTRQEYTQFQKRNMYRYVSDNVQHNISTMNELSQTFREPFPLHSAQNGNSRSKMLLFRGMNGQYQNWCMTV